MAGEKFGELTMYKIACKYVGYYTCNYLHDYVCTYALQNNM